MRMRTLSADAGDDADDERDVEDEKERTKEFIATGGKYTVSGVRVTGDRVASDAQGE